jgi:hypothetical protein
MNNNSNTQETNMNTNQYTSEELAAVGRHMRQFDPGFIEQLEEDDANLTDENIGEQMLECDTDEFEDILDSITF